MARAAKLAGLTEKTALVHAGLEALIEVNEAVSQTGCLLKLCGANETLREVLELTQLSSQFDQYADLNSAVRSFL